MNVSSRSAVALLLVAAGALAAPRAAADDAPPLDGEIEALRTLVRERRWDEAKAAADALYAAHRDDAEARPRLPEVEGLLRRALFGLSGWTLDPVAAIGHGATRFSASSRTATFDASGPSPDGWSRAVDHSRLLGVPFDGDVTVEMPWADASDWAVVLSWDPDTPAGLVVTLRALDHSGGEGTIVRVDENGAKELSKVASPKVGREPKSVRVVRAGSTLTVWGDRTQLAQAVVVGDRRGRAGLRPAPETLDGAGVPALRVTGKVDARFARRALADAESNAFRAWVETGYRRADAVPAWVLDLETAASRWAERVPEVPDAQRGALRAAVRAFFEDDAAAVRTRCESLEDVALPEAARSLLDGLAACEDGRIDDAAKALAAARTADPKSAAAVAAGALAAHRRGDEEAALRLADEARALDAGYAPAHDVRARVAFEAGDLDAAKAALDDAARAGTASAVTATLRAAVGRVLRGPSWPKRSVQTTDHFTVATDAGAAVASEVAKGLEDAWSDAHAALGRTSRTARVAVFVFAAEEPYLQWTRDGGGDPDETTALYLPASREIAARLVQDRAAFWAAIRPEIGRAALHREVGEAPPWLDAALAEEMTAPARPTSKPPAGKKGSAATAESTIDALRRSTLLARFRRRFLPLRDVLTADRAAFDESPDVLAVQSWTVLSALRDPKDPALRGTLGAYVDALGRGRGAVRAFRDAFEGVLDALRDEVAGRLDGR